ncbi:stage II sporulation protein M [Candidatus Woesearchaeota archaeon]|nr:stage II sporulation protein M [Candidatus Woesearchaeota archaeon]
MVLEALVNPAEAEKHPWEMFFIGILYATVAVFISIHIFESMAGLISVFLTVMACIPLLYATIVQQEEKDLEPLSEQSLLKEHSKAIMFLIFLFLGVVVSLSAWFTFLPEEKATTLFAIQVDTIKNINSNSIAGAIPAVDLFHKIFLNNVKVMIFCILFAFFYGAGAMFILIWNASVIAVAIGSFVRSHLAAALQLAGFPSAAAYFHAFGLALARYFIHGIPEIAAYFIAGLAGGIIGVAVVRHDFRSARFEKILVDTSDLLLISLGILFIAGLLEVYVTPVFF